MSAEEESSATAASYSESEAIVFLIGLAGVCVAALVGWRLRNIRRWRLRAHSAKVLDEIEMEFVNYDVDMFVLEDEGELPRSSSRRAPTAHRVIFLTDLTEARRV